MTPLRGRPAGRAFPIAATADRIRALAMCIALLVLASLALLAGGAPAQAAGRVDVSPVPSADAATTVTLSGSGFQYQPNAPGGVYVFFGAVSDPSTNAWAPSQGGKSGDSFAYAATDGSRLLVAFEGGASAEAANGMIDAGGNWSAQMTIPGSTFTASFGDPHSGNAQSGQEIDCLQVQCGIITIGAHGMVNGNNESFTPVSFATGSGEVRSGTGAAEEFGSSGENAGETEQADEATQLDVPGSEEQETESETTDAAVPAAPEAAETDPASSDSTLTWIVLGVLAFAVVALLVAVVLVLVKRRRAKRAGAAPSGAAPPDGTQPDPAPQAPERHDAEEVVR